MNKTLLFAGIMASALAAHATLYSTNFTWTVGAALPDNNPSGWVNSQTISDPLAGSIVPGTLAVNLNLSGGWNGDLYAYLVSSSGGFCVLLDRIGSGPYGDAHAGMNVTLTDHATLYGPNQGNLNAYAGIPIPTGVWNPDATSGSLGSFPSPNGTWSLFIADLSGGGVTTVNSWGLQMDIVAVPEVETWVAAALAGAVGAFWLNRQIMRGIKSS
jgi:subtilisin-like proprotein convertase family protein